MSFAEDFAKHSDARIADLSARRAAVIDAAFALCVDPDGSFISTPSIDAITEVAKLNAESDVLAAQIEAIRIQVALYVTRERDAKAASRHRLEVQAPRATDSSLLKTIRREQPIRQRNWGIDSPAINCSLHGSPPPWEWTWGSGFVPFSDMQLIPHGREQHWISV